SCARSSPPVTGSDRWRGTRQPETQVREKGKMKKLNAILAGAALAVAAVALSQPGSAQDDKLEQLRAQGFARVAIANEPPFTAVANDGTVSGAAPDVARVIFERLGVPEIVGSISEYGAMIPGLQARRHDVV